MSYDALNTKLNEIYLQNRGGGGEQPPFRLEFQKIETKNELNGLFTFRDAIVTLVPLCELSVQELAQERELLTVAFRKAMQLGTEPRLDNEGRLVFGATDTPERLMNKLSGKGKGQALDIEALMAQYETGTPLQNPFMLRPAPTPKADASPVLTQQDIEVLELKGFHDKLLAIDNALIDAAETETQMQLCEKFGTFRETYEAMMKTGGNPTVYLENSQSIPLTRNGLLGVIQEVANEMQDNHQIKRLASTAKTILTTVLQMDQEKTRGFERK